MRITLSSIYVDDQDKALRFYTEILGFEKHTEIPVGEFRWLTVSTTGESPAIELALEPNHHPAAKTYQEALYKDGIPITSFACSDVASAYERLIALDVQFRVPPTPAGDTIIAMFDDTCGNFLQIHQD